MAQLPGSVGSPEEAGYSDGARVGAGAGAGAGASARRRGGAAEGKDAAHEHVRAVVFISPSPPPDTNFGDSGKRPEGSVLPAGRSNHRQAELSEGKAGGFGLGGAGARTPHPRWGSSTGEDLAEAFRRFPMPLPAVDIFRPDPSVSVMWVPPAAAAGVPAPVPYPMPSPP